ncbi:MAG TPA: hypothetical protein VK968_02080 [Roseimicrobium sp.]|nr:hypothetical protein [Roseimicrobium sp.]
MNDKKMRRVVIASPAYYTGGPEALHQLDHALRQKGVESSVLYFGPRNEAVIQDFEHRYGTRSWAGEPTGAVILVIPEVEDPQVWRTRGWSRITVWWLAVARLYPLHHYNGCFHLFQSQFARETRGQEGVRGMRVSDYLRTDLFRPGEPGGGAVRRRKIACNHRSAGWLAGARLEELDRELVVIEGMTADHIPALLRSSAYFVDVGWHPGRDRMVREAALCGCRVLAGRQGAAAFAEDLPLPDCLRLEDGDTDSLRKRIAACEADPQAADNAMAAYRRWIAAQEDVFHAEVGAWVQAPEGPWHAESGPQFPEKTVDPVPAFYRELAQARTLQTVAGLRFLRMRNSLRPSGWFYRLELHVRKGLRALKGRTAGTGKT